MRSIGNIQQITRAMEMVSASKMRRAQQHVQATRPYAERIRAMVGDLATMTSFEDAGSFPLLIQRPIKRSEVIMITSDRGLAGAFNANVIRGTISFIQQERARNIDETDMVAVGRKGRDFMTHLRQTMIADFTSLPDYPSFDDVRPIVRIAIDDFIEGRVDAVHVSYTQFVNTMRQIPVIEQVLPIQAPAGAGEITDYIFEPSSADVLHALLPRFVEVQIYQALLESIASEHSARMISMHNATDAAHDLVTELTMSLNKARQTKITNEVAEIAAGAAALGGS